MGDAGGVAPFTGAWIEMIPAMGSLSVQLVAPFTGAWIEIRPADGLCRKNMSLPSRERGLKLDQGQGREHTFQVAPFTGAWIEMFCLRVDCLPRVVAPFTGAWIEIAVTLRRIGARAVAPFTGAWIEIGHRLSGCEKAGGRSLHGSVY